MKRTFSISMIVAGIFLIILSIGSFFLFASGIQIVQIGRYSSGSADNLHGSMATDIFIENDIAYLVYSPNGLDILDISNPDDIKELAQIDNDNCSFNTRKILVNNGIAYLSIFYDGLELVDVSDPSDPSIIGFYENNCSILDTFLSNDVAFVAAGENGVEILNISEPSNIIQIGNYTDSYNMSWGIDFNEQKNLLYVADRSDGLEILDVSNLSAPFEVGQLKMERAIGIDVIENLAFITLYENGISIVDVTNSSNPVETSRFEQGIIKDLFVNGSFVYLVSDTGLLMVDISNPAAPEIVSIYSKYNNAEGVFVSKNLIFYANGYNGLEILEIKPSNLKYYTAAAFFIPGVILIYMGLKSLSNLNEENQRMQRIIRNY
ncbi:MAG: LVIVD repeat-containing protein [Promethearchaeota archaeon]